ncbi:sensor histidine kinase [Paenibacillus cymbidii]|uniref:sensor histidine kinase n=1 Tax=Paenibacillus cymbidii TaxID=1639034 RepID=UPI00108117D0|nr:sensor histidine kinase [Paenibacillus cymbidii]
MTVWTNWKPRSFRFRLLLYLFVVGSIPLALAAVVFYRESSGYSRGELGEHTRIAHIAAVADLQGVLQEMNADAAIVAADTVLRHFNAGTPGTDRTTAFARMRELRDTIVGASRYITDICLYIDKDGSMLCGNTEAFASDSSSRMFMKNEKRYRIAAFRGLAGDGRNYSAFVLNTALAEPETGVVYGQIAVIANAGELLRDIAARYPAAAKLTVADGDIVAGTSGSAPMETDAADYVSTMPVDAGGAAWSSTLTMRGDAMTQGWRSLRNSLIALLVVLFVLSLASAIVFSRFVTKPLEALRRLMKRAQAGDLRAYWTESSTAEIDDVGDSYNEMLSRLDELFRRFKREEALKKEAEIEALTYQLNPHFLYNTLNTIKWVAKMHRTPQIADAVSALVRLLQASLGKKGEFLTVREEVSLIGDYMAIQTFRYGDQVRFDAQIDPLSARCLVPRMILQPLAENAILHGIAPSGRSGTVTVRTWTERDMLLCQVEDDGVGLHRAEPAAPAAAARSAQAPDGEREKLSGIGLAHIREKIKLYYGSDAKLYVFAQIGGGTVVRLTLPIHLGEE